MDQNISHIMTARIRRYELANLHMKLGQLDKAEKVIKAALKHPVGTRVDALVSEAQLCHLL